jgi:hypothetical protein
MTTSVLIAHSPEDTELAEQIAAALQTLSAQTTAICSSLRTDGQTVDTGVRAGQIAGSQAVVALLTTRSARSHDVLLQLGAGWALGKRLVLLLDTEQAASQSLPPVPAQRVLLNADSLIALAETLANATGGRAELGPAAKLVLSELFPGWGPVRESSEQPIARDEARADETQQLFPTHPPTDPPPAAPARMDSSMLPRASSSLDAGRSLADAVFESEGQPANPDQLDVPFGAFLASLGGNWSSLREIPDVDVWREATENLLEALPPEAQPTRGWYEVGFHAALLLHLARRQLELEGADESLERQWQAAWSALREGAWRAGLPQTSVDELHAMLDNLRGPLRDFTNLGRAQSRVQELAVQADSGPA